MDTLHVAFLASGALGVIGGAVAAWVAMRTATRVAVKIVKSSLDGIDAASAISARVGALEQWRRELERLAEAAELARRAQAQ